MKSRVRGISVQASGVVGGGELTADETRGGPVAGQEDSGRSVGHSKRPLSPTRRREIVTQVQQRLACSRRRALIGWISFVGTVARRRWDHAIVTEASHARRILTLRNRMTSNGCVVRLERTREKTPVIDLTKTCSWMSPELPRFRLRK